MTKLIVKQPANSIILWLCNTRRVTRKINNTPNCQIIVRIITRVTKIFNVRQVLNANYMRNGISIKEKWNNAPAANIPRVEPT